LLATGTLLVITAIFDNLIIGTGIVAYDEALISGIKIGLAPIEDFSYSLAGPLLIAILSKVFGLDNQEKSKR
jgi:lycopene cyclase domain-containing protein